MVNAVIDQVLLYVGMALVSIGAAYDVIAGIGMIRFPNFYVRLHAATIGAVGGAALPLVGVALIALASDQLGSYRFGVCMVCLLTAVAILITAPTGSHILAYAAYKARASPREPCVHDALRNFIKEGGEEE